MTFCYLLPPLWLWFWFVFIVSLFLDLNNDRFVPSNQSFIMPVWRPFLYYAMEDKNQLKNSKSVRIGSDSGIT